jgi:hypothetical protein
MIFIHLNYLLCGYALLQAAKEGHGSVISTILNLCPRGGLPYELSYGEVEQELQGRIIETFRCDGWDPDSASWKKLLHKTNPTKGRKENEIIEESSTAAEWTFFKG